jgi:tRNA-Thr(GGU) m(6)t(6)A37 methyltransferase TsaA
MFLIIFYNELEIIMEITMNQIGTVNTPFCSLENMPVQPQGAKDVYATIELYEKYKKGLKDLAGFSHIYLLYYFHKVQNNYDLEVIPFNDKTNTKRGVFSTRTPMHPNNIGLSLVKIVDVHDNKILIQGIDILNGTPLLDIKPYVENFDIIVPPVKNGWVKSEKGEISRKRSDGRFVMC